MSSSKIIINLTLFFKWILILVLVGVVIGSASALFLSLLAEATDFRIRNEFIVWFLPLAGFLIGYSYHRYGKVAQKGNNLLLEAYKNPDIRIPLLMAPLVFFGTLITHLFGGSAGREGTAVQMGGTIAHQINRIFNLDTEQQSILTIMGISAGFSSVFGTPITGAVFALEIVCFKKLSFQRAIFSLLSAYIAYFIVELWHVKHTNYSIDFIPSIDLPNIMYCLIVGFIFGLAALLFSLNMHFWQSIFKNKITYPPLRPFAGGLVLALLFSTLPLQQFEGLGLPVIQNAFVSTNEWYVPVLKLLLTGFTLGCGFKGGEVTPLFFIGATLGSLLSLLIPLPLSLLAAMGFVAVFSGATHTPIACTIMGMELFGINGSLFIGITCFTAYLSSGTNGIYSSQSISPIKSKLYFFLQKWSA